jgi:sugar phosphate isomerase/epimerase
MYLTALTTSLPYAFDESVRCLADMGFSRVDVAAVVDRPLAQLEVLAETSLVVSCAAVGRDLPPGRALDEAEVKPRREALSIVKRQIDDAAVLGATHCYLTAGHDASPEGVVRFTEACMMLADHARKRMVRLCVEHVPGRALSSAGAVLEWLIAADHPNLFLLLDVGHCQITGERPRTVIERAGTRLRYVHLDDNDGKQDLHLPLFAGLLKEDDLADVLSSLGEADYDGALCLELSAQLPQPEDALRQGKEIVEKLLG